MKRNIILSSISGLVLIIFLISCTKDDSGDDNSGTKTQIENNLSVGTWRIAYFFDSDKDETGMFAGYNFAFGENAVLTATNGSVTYTGTWRIDDSSMDDDSEDELDFTIHFNLTNNFEDLNDDWDILSQSDSRIELIDISGGNGGQII